MALRQLYLHCAVCGEFRPHLQDAPNHVLHAAVTLFTGIWVIPWIVIALQQKPAVCGKCGTHRLSSGPPQHQLAAGPRTQDQIESAVDDALRKLKGPLRTCRARHGIVGDVTFRLRYEPSGTIVGVTIDNGPPNISPGFIQDSMTIIKGMLVLPASANGGVMLFTDLETDSGVPYR